MPLLSLTAAQLLLVFVIANILKKLRPNHCFLTWLSSRITFCCMPTNQELRKIGGTKQEHGTSSKKNNARHKNRQLNLTDKHNNEQNSDVFKIRAQNLKGLNLETTKLDSRILSVLPKGDELEWVVDFAFMSNFSFLITQLLFYFYPDTSEYNFSLIWILLVIVRSLVSLARITANYFIIEKSIGERSICIVSGCVFFLIAIVILIADENNNHELGLDDAFRSLSRSFVRTNQSSNSPLLDVEPQIRATKSISLIMIKFVIAAICSFIAVILTFPGLRFGQLHEALLESPSTTAFQKFLYILNYLSSLIVICFWIKPLSRSILMKQEMFPIDETNFDTIRICVIIGINIFRLTLAPKYIAMFLASGSKCIDQIRQRGSVTTNREIRFAISSINNYVNVVSMQYILPTLICLYTCIMLLPTTITNESSTSHRSLEYLTSLLGEQSPFASAETILTGIRRLFSPLFYKGIFGFTTWWFHFSWFCTTTAGVIYHKYFTHQIN